MPKPTATPPDVWFDYDNQAWVVDGRYSKCGHRAATPGCYACAHVGEIADQANRRDGDGR